jgi:hypothetical protein
MKRYFPVLVFFLCTLLAGAQAPMLKGYIVTEKGDTLRGEIKPNKKELENYNKVTFKDQNANQKVYRPTKLKGYGMNEDHYIAMDSDEERKFYKVMARGPISFYKLGYEGMRMNAIVFEVEYYIALDGEQDLMVVKENKFKKQMSEWMKDNLDFINEYGEEKEFNVEKALTVITQYNSWKTGK